MLVWTEVPAASMAAEPSVDAERSEATKARAEDPPEEQDENLEIEVVGYRPVATPGGAAAIDARPDSLHTNPAPTLEEVFEELSFIFMRTNSRGEAELSTRGSDSRQVAVLVDGAPITLAWDARADVSVIPATAPQEMRYVRGISSMLHGPNVLGGVVELKVGRSLIQPQDSYYVLNAGVDHVGGSRATGRLTMPFIGAGGSWVLRVGAGFRDSPGQPLARGVEERAETDDDLRLNTDSRVADGFMSLRYIADGGAWCALSASGFGGRRGIAAELGVPDEEARFWRYPHVSRALAVLSAGTGSRSSPLGGYGELEASAGLDYGRTDIDAYTSASYQDLDGFEDGDDRTLTVRLRGNQTLGPKADLSAAATLAEVRHDERLPEGDARYRQRLWSASGEADVRLNTHWPTAPSCRLSVGGAFDACETPEAGGKEPSDAMTGWGGRAGISLGLRNPRTQLHAAVSARSRFPALRELYSGALNRFEPNPDIDPERLITIEGGATTRFRRGKVQAIVFHNLLKDAIVRIKQPELDGRYLRVNRDELTSTGLELFASRDWGRYSFAANLTAQSVSITNTEAGLTNRPENLPEIFGGASLRARLWSGFVGGVQARYTGRQYAIDPETGGDARLDAGTCIDVEITRSWGSSLETTLAVDNVTNEAVYDLIGLPRPGLAARLQFRYTGLLR